MTYLLLALLFLTSVALLLAWLRASRLARRSSEECVALRERLRANEEIARRDEELTRRTEERFELMAREIVERQTDTFRQHSERRLSELLTPLRENIEQFRQSVTECYTSEARERFSLKERIRELIETNQSIGREARELSTALRGNNKVQGDWGEIVLENILERSGLRRGEEFTVQDSSAVADDPSAVRLRPDVVIHYPDGRGVIIDSKVSLTAFVEYANADDDETRKHYGRLHLESVKRHVAELHGKAYQDRLSRESLDFVMMFIPNEAAYLAAMSVDPMLWQTACDRRVLIVSPTHLVSALRLVSQLWSHDRQTRNAIDIADTAGRMYDKFAGFVDDMKKIERSLDSTRAAYDAAMNKLCSGTGNLISRAERLREMGIKASRQVSAPRSSGD